MAEEKKPEAAAPAPAAGGGLGAWLPLILAVVLLPALAFGMTKFVIVPQLQKSLGIKESAEGAHGEKSKKGGDDKKASVQLSELLVNIAGTGATRYLVSSVTVVGTGGEVFKTKMKDNDPQIRDMAMATLERKTLADLEKPGARNLIRTELINGINGVLGDASVQELYITKFAVQ